MRRTDAERRARLDLAEAQCRHGIAENGRDLASEVLALRFLDDEREDAAREGRPVSRAIREAVLGTAVVRTSVRSEELVERRTANGPTEEPEYEYDPELDLPPPENKPDPEWTEEPPPDEAA